MELKHYIYKDPSGVIVYYTFTKANVADQRYKQKQWCQITIFIPNIKIYTFGSLAELLGEGNTSWGLSTKFMKIYCDKDENSLKRLIDFLPKTNKGKSKHYLSISLNIPGNIIKPISKNRITKFINSIRLEQSLPLNIKTIPESFINLNKSELGKLLSRFGNFNIKSIKIELLHLLRNCDRFSILPHNVPFLGLCPIIMLCIYFAQEKIETTKGV